MGELIFDVGVTARGAGLRDIRVSAWKPEEHGGAVEGDKIVGACDYMELGEADCGFFGRKDIDEQTERVIAGLKQLIQEQYEDQVHAEELFSERPKHDLDTPVKPDKTELIEKGA